MSLHLGNADYHIVDDSYLEQRQLKGGSAGWVLLTNLGVATVIAGHFAGWNYGISFGGWGGMMVALILVATMYLCISLSLAEMASIIPTAGGGYGFARRAFGPLFGFITGITIVFEYLCAAAAIVFFIGANLYALIGINGWKVFLACWLVFMSIHCLGVGEALRLLMVLAVFAVSSIILFILSSVPYLNFGLLFNIPPSTGTFSNVFLPYGVEGIFFALPFAMATFLGVEAIPLASEEAKNPQKSVPKGLFMAMLILMSSALLLAIFVPGTAGSGVIGISDTPLIDAINQRVGQHSFIRTFINIAALIGLFASLFSVIFAYSRQIFSLSRAGYLPTFLSKTNRRKSPYIAIIIPGTIGFFLSLSGTANQLVVILMFCGAISYVIMMSAHIYLRNKEKNTHRPYRTPGGILTSSLALLLSIVALVSSIILNDMTWNLVGLVAVSILVGYYFLYGRHHLIASAPEEEFEAIKLAEKELVLMAK